MTAANNATIPSGVPVAQPVYTVDATTGAASPGGGGTQYTDGAAAPAHPIGTQIIFNNSGTETAVSAANGLPITGSITATNPSVGTDGAAIPASSTLIGGSDGTNLQPLQVDGSKNLKITGTVTANQAGTWTVQPGNTANTTAWKVDGSAVTQPVSAASLPLPTGASTAAKQPALGTAGTASADVLSVQGIAGMTALNVAQQASGSVSATLQSAATTTGAGTALSLLGNASCVFTVSGTYTGLTMAFQGTEDNTNYSTALSVTQIGTNTILTSITANGLYECSVAGLQKVQANITAIASGSVTVTGHAVPVTFTTRVNNVNLQAGSATVGNVGLVAGSAVIGHVIADSGSTTAVTQATAANLNATATIQAVTGTSLAADQTNSELRVSNYVKTTTAGDTALTLGQATMANSLPVTMASNQSNIPANIAQWNGATPSLTNEVAVANVSNGETSITSPADGTAISATTDTLITFSANVKRIRMQNEHASVNVYWRTDGVSSTAFNKIAANGNITEWIDVNCAVLHLFADAGINFNAAGGFKVRGYA